MPVGIWGLVVGCRDPAEEMRRTAMGTMGIYSCISMAHICVTAACFRYPCSLNYDPRAPTPTVSIRVRAEP